MARTAQPAKTLRKSPPAALPGAVCAQWVRCNKPACRRCPHGPYYRRFWRVGGRLRSAYVRKRDVARVRVACAVYAQQRYDDRRLMREAVGYSRMSARELIALLREVEGWEL